MFCTSKLRAYPYSSRKKAGTNNSTISERRSRAIWRNSLRPTASVLRMLDHVKKHVLERRHHTIDAGDLEPSRVEPGRQLRKVDVRCPQYRVYGRSEYRGLLHFRLVFQLAHDVDRTVRIDFENRPLGEDLLQLARGAHRSKLAGIDDCDAMAVLGFVQVVRGHQDRDPCARHIFDETPELPARHRIDATSRLVEKNDAGL